MQRTLTASPADFKTYAYLEAAPSSILITDTALEAPGPRILYVNEAFERMTGWSRSEIVGCTPRVLQGPETDRTIFRNLARVLAGGETWYGETVNYRRNGEPFVLKWSISPVLDTDGTVSRYMAIQEDVTEERRRQAQHDRLNSLVDRLMEASAEGVLVTDADRRVVHFNRGAEEIFGWRADEVIGQPVSLVSPELHLRMPVGGAERPAGPRAVAQTEMIGLRRDGQEFPATASVGALAADEGGGWAVIVRDLTEQTRRERALKDSERRFRALFELSYQFVGLLAPDGTVLECNRSSLEFGGTSLDEVRGKPFWDTPWWSASAPSRARLKDAVRQAAQGQFARMTATVRGGDGKDYAVDVTIKPVFDDRGQVALLIPEGRDITEILDKQQELERAAARMRNAQRIGRMGSWDYDPVSDRLTFDAEVGQLFGLEGYGGEMSLGQLYELVHPDDRERVMAAVAAAVGEGAPYDCEFRLCMPDMGGCVVHAVGESVPGGQDGQRTLMGVAQDVTEDYRARQELIAARNAAQAASEAKSRFLATMGHELRTPLNAINGFSELIQSEAFGPVGAAQYKTYAGHIHDSGQHLLELINRILDVTRVEAGAFHLEETDVRGAALVQKTVELLSGEARRQGIAISCEPGPEVELLADPRLLRQVIFNLVNNALRFSPARSAVRVSAGPTARGGYAVRVADQGPGIAEDQRARVLLPFTQGDDSLARKHDGLGLGLYLVRSFTELHGGDLDIDCPETGGTAVTVTLPPTRVATAPTTGR